MSDQVVIPSPSHGKKVFEYTLKSGDYAGMKIMLNGINAMIVNKVMESVEVPKRPTYTTKTISGREEKLPMDEKSAKETVGGEEIWKAYVEDRDRALGKQNSLTVSAILAMGTRFKVPDDGWEQVQIAMGIEIPTIPDLLRAHFLMTKLDDPNELNDIIGIIMRLTGVSETVIAAAEGAFRDSVRDRSEGPDEMAVAGANPSEVAAWNMASQ